MNSTNYDYILTGNYLTTMIAALELSGYGKKICIVNPMPTWGGHFIKLNVAGINFDPGAISHEFTSFDEKDIEDPLLYSPSVRNDWGRFTNLIEKYTKSYIELVKMQVPNTVYNGQIFPDIIMANRLELLQHPFLKGRIKLELDDILRKDKNDVHPKTKKTNHLFLERSYHEISIANHGASLHAAIFESYFHKMSNLSSTLLLARYHRIGWLPLFYPETVSSQFSHNPQKLNETYFCYPKAGYSGIFSETLLGQIQKSGITIYREAIEKLEDSEYNSSVTLKDGQTLTAKKIIWSLSHDQLISSVTGKSPNIFERWSATLVFLTIPQKELLKSFSVLWSPDDTTLFYRVSNQTDCSGSDEENARIVVELNPDYLQTHGIRLDEEIINRVKKDFCTLGFVSSPAHINISGIKNMKNVLLLPSLGNWKLLENERDILYDKFPNVLFTRNTEAFFTDTLNDQIIKGLKIAEQFKD